MRGTRLIAQKGENKAVHSMHALQRDCDHLAHMNTIYSMCEKSFRGWEEEEGKMWKGQECVATKSNN